METLNERGALSVSTAPLEVTTLVFVCLVGAAFALWRAVEGTLSIRSITTTRREAFYWLVVLFTFALGTATGDLVAEQFGLGYLASALIVGALIAALTALHYGLGLDGVLTFWLVTSSPAPSAPRSVICCRRTTTPADFNSARPRPPFCSPPSSSPSSATSPTPAWTEYRSRTIRSAARPPHPAMLDRAVANLSSPATRGHDAARPNR